MRKFQTFRLATFAAITPFLVGGCAAGSGDFPSLAVRDVERVSGSFEPAPAEPWVSPPAPAEALGRLEGLKAQASAAHSAFLVDAGNARAAVVAGQGAEEGSDAWAEAQIALASLQSVRAPALVSMAELDRLYTKVMTEAAEAAEIDAARREVLAMVEAEDRLIGELNQVISQ